jgi:hypothetical protein
MNSENAEPKIYNYDPITGIFIEEGFADPDPLQPGDWLLPAHSTLTKPPQAAQGQVAVIGEDGEWSLMPDHRGSWYNAQGVAVQISDVQADVSGLVREAPPSADHELVSGQWQLSAAKVQASFEKIKTARIASFRAEREVVLNRFAGMGMAAMHTANNSALSAAERAEAQAAFEAIMLARQGLLDLTKHASIVGATNEAQLKAAFKTLYATIIAGLPQALRSAFASIDS